MKHLFFRSALAVFIFLEFITYSSFAVNTDVVTSKELPVAANPEFRPKVTISFIIARRRDCLGFGICKITFDVTSGRMNGCIGNLYADVTGKNMIIEIDKNTGMERESYTKYFASGKFLMEDETPIPNEILKELGISGSRTLQAGNHEVLERNGKLFVTIPVR